MKLFISLVLCLASLVAGVPAPAPDTAEAAVANANPLSDYHAFNVAIPETTDGVDTIEARGYDPSTEWQKHAMVEVWTGGAKRQPMN
ncbi:hypothetical protein C7974DRAFT_409833 [Boeremia exigua]|uniref:uncharacterized protein n=1 Tax=Boeremia exigua TaxID=749465 RepID=UPI001E8EDF2F|nr:uncharacterized protein C7974DRAFT_409833 [Boeremia exigua]KAH6638829.1 hypothetical protein C7974DRAFT_409833 [Boeremia exigua]